MPTRRIFEVSLAVVLLAHPALGLFRLWAAKTLGTQEPNTLAYKAAEIITVIS